MSPAEQALCVALALIKQLDPTLVNSQTVVTLCCRVLREGGVKLTPEWDKFK